MYVLVVEDQPILQQILEEILQQAGFHVFVCGSAEAVYEQGIASLVDLAIIDINLPGENGLELSKKLKQVKPQLGIVILTIHHELDIKIKSYDCGADQFLSKPVDPQELIASLMALKRRIELAYDATQNLMLNPVKQKLFNGHDQVALSYVETQTLYHLLQAEDFKLEYWQLMDICNLDLDDKGRKQLEVMISRLRAKFIRLGLTPHTLKSIRGYGYALCARIKLQA